MHRIFILFTPIFLYSQNIDMYMSLIHEGQVDGVKEQLPELISKYPNNPGVLYLQALMTTDGMKSLELYSNLLDKFPESKYSADAALKIGEYFYARGLYSQAGQQLCDIPRVYPRFQDIQRVVDLMVSSFRAIGEEDSVTYYVGIYQSMFPNLDVTSYEMKNNKVSSDPIISRPKRIEPKPYVIQIGAFSSIENAKRLKLQVSQIGYDVKLVQVDTNGRSLNAVRVVSYKNKTEAERVGKVLKKKLGTDYRVLYRPKSQKM